MKFITITAVGLLVILLEFSTASQDVEPPKITCPADIDIVTKQFSTRVTWDRLKVSDNSHGPITQECSFRSGMTLRRGTYKINCRAEDQSGNRAFCTFTVKISAPLCKMPAAPHNGVTTCFQSTGGDHVCTVSCNSKYDFASRPAMVFLCRAATWTTYLGSFPWSDCSVKSHPGKPRVSPYPFNYYQGDPADPNVLLKIKQDFVVGLRSPNVPPFFCLFLPQCTIQNVKVYVGKQYVKK